MACVQPSTHTGSMLNVLVINAEQVAELLDPEELRVSLEEALIAHSAGQASVPPRIAAETPSGLLAAMPGYSAAHGGVLATKLVSVFPGNREHGLPSHMGLIALFDHVTGTPLAIMDAEVITEMRTAGTAAIGADLCARSDADVLTIVGAGAQARAHVHAFGPLRAWKEIRFINRTQPAAVVVAAQARASLGAKVVIASDFDDFESAVRGADVVALTTHSDSGVIDGSWIDPGTHVSSVGSSSELPLNLVGVGPLVVDHRGTVTTAPPAGAAEIQGLDPDSVIELGELLAGTRQGRTDADQVTVYKSTGHAVQDLAAAQLVYGAAVAANVGVSVAL